MKRKAIGYVRVSTKDQAESGVSLDAQRTKIRAFVTMHDLELVEVIDDGGHSAKSLDRPGMQRLLDMVRRHDADIVIVAKLDRLTRSVRDLGDLVEVFNRCGVEFASIADSIDTTTAAGRLVLNVMGSVAQWEREAIGERTAEALAQMRADGKRISRHAPFGFRFDGSGWIEDAREQRAISVIHDLRAKGLSLRKIAAALEERGITGRTGNRLSPQLVANVLKRKAA